MQANSQALTATVNLIILCRDIWETKMPSVARRGKSEQILIRDTRVLIQSKENDPMFGLKQDKFPDFPRPFSRDKK